MSQREFKLHRSDFKRLCEIVYSSTGIVLKDSKFDMVYGRLARRLRELKFDDFCEYLAFIQSTEGAEEVVNFTNVITTNLTRFFRECHHFQHLREQLLKPMSLAARKGHVERQLKIWSAGCSSGQEPYTIAMTVKASLPASERWSVKILATDIDTNMLNHGKSGEYRESEIEGIPQSLAQRFLTVSGGKICMAPDLRKIIAFKHLNLMDPWPMQGAFDAIFCRNVMIYFDKETQRKLVKRYVELLRPGGFLYVGHAESLLGEHPELTSEGQSTFQRVLPEEAKRHAC